MAINAVEQQIEQLAPVVAKIMEILAERIGDAIRTDSLVSADSEIIAVRDELLGLLRTASNLQFGILKNEPDVPTTTEKGRYLAGLAIKRAPDNPQGAVRMPVLPNRIAGKCSFDPLFEDLGPDNYRKLIEFDCLSVLVEIQKRQASADATNDRHYRMTMLGGPSGTYRGGESAHEFGIVNFSQADIDNRYSRRAYWLLNRLKHGESPFSVVQPFKKIRPDYEESRSA